MTSERKNTLVGYTNYNIKSFSIITQNGQSIDLSIQAVDLNIFFDLFAPTSSGTITFIDGNDIIAGYVARETGAIASPIFGLEDLIITFNVLVDGKEETFDKFYRIDKVYNRSPSRNGATIYEIHFISNAKIRSLTSKVNKSFKGVANHDIIKEICRDHLLEEVEVDTTSGTYDYIIPNLRPLQAISWVASKSHSTGPYSTSFFFFETVDGFKFKSLQSLYKQEPKFSKPYTFGSKLMADETDSSRNPEFEIIDFKFQEFDMQNAFVAGGISSKMLGVDIFNQSTNVYEESFSKNIGSSLNGNLPFYDPRSKWSEKYDTYFLMSNEVKDQSTAADNDVQYILNRTQSMAMIRHYVIKFEVPGNWVLSPGDIIEIAYFKFKVPEHQTNSIDENQFRNGKFLVTAVNHHLSGKSMLTTVEAASDSLAAALSQRQGGDAYGGGEVPPILSDEDVAAMPIEIGEPTSIPIDTPDFSNLDSGTVDITEPSNVPVTGIPDFTNG